jgi:hypothetical protein
MNSIQGKWLALGIGLGCFAIELALLVLAPKVLATPLPHQQHSSNEVSESLSWYEAQQRKYQRLLDNTTNPSAEPNVQAPVLSAEQENKLVTMVKLLTLEL